MPQPTHGSPLVDPGPIDLDDLSPAARAFVVHELRSRKVFGRWRDGQLSDWDLPPVTSSRLAHLASEMLVSAVRNITPPYDIVVAAQAPAGVPQQASSGIAAVLSKTQMERHGDWVSWPSTRFIPILCSDVEFAAEPHVPAVGGTAFAVAPDRMITAGHVLTPANYDTYCFVFGPWTHDPVRQRIHVPTDAVRHAKRVTHHSYNASWSVADYCIVELTDPAPAGTYLATIDPAPIRHGAPLYMLGHARGLALKYVSNAWVTSTDSPIWIGTTLDVLPGDSGAPVFDADTDMVVGIVSHGVGDTYRPHGECVVLMTCEPCNESCTRIALLDALLA